jgi:hypothetical protein
MSDWLEWSAIKKEKRKRKDRDFDDIEDLIRERTDRRFMPPDWAMNLAIILSFVILLGAITYYAIQ